MALVPGSAKASTAPTRPSLDQRRFDPHGDQVALRMGHGLDPHRLAVEIELAGNAAGPQVEKLVDVLEVFQPCLACRRP